MATPLRTREEIEPAYLWNLDSYYTSDQLWEADYQEVERKLPTLASYAGRVAEHGASVLAALTLRDTVNARVDRLTVYATLRRDENIAHSTNQARLDRANALEVRFRTTTAFFRPELLAVDDLAFEHWFQSTPALAPYRFHLEDMRRVRAHTRSAEVEAVLAQAGELAQTPTTIFAALNNADLRFGTIRDQPGEEVELSHGRVWALLEHANRDMRRTAWEQYGAAYRTHQTTFSAILNGAIRANIFNARAHGYDSALEAALDPDAIPTSVYHTLIATTHEHLPIMARYLHLRKQVLGLDTMHFYDLAAPLAVPPQATLSYDDARKIVLAALAPLGEAYIQALRRGLYEECWADVYETANKRSGAYSWSAYGTQPVMLLNWQNLFSDLFVLAHEIGHAMHSYFTYQNQPYMYGNYTIFVAEVASTCNEALLFAHLLRTTTDAEQKRYLVSKQLDNISGTLFTQVMFAEFEREVHDRIEHGEALAAERFTEMGARIEAAYNGPDVVADDTTGLFWALLPHYYMNFYVYKYATGISAGLALAHQILTEGQPAVERYLHFLRSGGSQSSINLLQQAGVDMTTPQPVEQALQVFAGLVEQLEALVND
jgi:oligoendopeptidase F